MSFLFLIPFKLKTSQKYEQWELKLEKGKLSFLGF